MPDKKDVALKLENRIFNLLKAINCDDSIDHQTALVRGRMGIPDDGSRNPGLSALKDMFGRQIKAQYDAHKLDKDLVENVFKTGNTYTWDSEEMKYLTMWVDAGIDELQEVRGHLNWKSWKQPKAITENDILNTRLELVDLLHFFINAYVMLGGTPESLIAEYHAKRDENDDRQKNGY